MIIFNPGLLFLPNIIVGVAIILVLLIAYRPESRAKSLLLYPLSLALITGVVLTIWMVHGITTSKSSTAPIGFFFLPFCALAAANVAFLLSWAVLYVIRFARERLGYLQSHVAAWPLMVLAIMILMLAGYTAQHDIQRYLLLQTAASSGIVSESRESMLASAISSNDLEILTALAKNPSTPGDDLIRIHQWSQTTLGKSKPFEYPIFFALAKNPSTPSTIFDVLAKSHQRTIRLMVAQNTGVPKDILRQLAEDSDQLVRNQAKTQLHNK